MDLCYPFGLTMKGISSQALTGHAENKFRFNGIEFENSFGVDYYDAFFREYDPAIGRWWEIDPKTNDLEKWSPYAANFNNPISFSDSLGDWPILRILAKKGAEFAAKTMKGSFKPVSREQALKLLKEGKSVFQTNSNKTNKVAKKLMVEAAEGKKVVRHDGHTLPNGQTGKPHFQKKAGDGSHVFYSAAPVIFLTLNTALDKGTSGPAGLIDILAQQVGVVAPELKDSFKNLFGNNSVTRFLDNYLNPFNK